MKSFEFTLLKECPECGNPLSIGFARCTNPGCTRLRPEFEPHGAVVTSKSGPCMWSGKRTDVRLPDGKYLWAPYFLDAVRAGWLDNEYRFTEKYRAARDNKNK
ncbi:MAG: hypothetical protein JXR37_34470 [Kiritimatiellae bacterium]|nr:hypothetical protein [Kiritimatiellia bacterium]